MKGGKMKMSKKEVLELVKIINEKITNLTINKKVEIENIGRIFNNKLNELNRYYEKRNQSFYEGSFIGASILEYFCFLIEKGTQNLASYCMRKEAKNLKRYQELCDQIFEFDIEKDLEEALRICLIKDCFNGEVYYYKIDHHTRERYNHEMQALGYTKTMETLLTEVKMSYVIKEIQEKYSPKTPKIALSLLNQITYYANQMTLALEKLDLVSMRDYREKIISFEIANEIEKSLVYVFIEVLKMEDITANTEWQETKEELILLGLGHLIPQIEARIMTGLKREVIKN